MKRTEQIGLRISPELKKALAELAKAESRSLSSYIVLVLEDHIKTKAEKTEMK
jgi:hypothetical protein